MMKLVLGVLLLAIVGVVATCTLASPWRRELRNKRLDEAQVVNLDDLGSVRLAPTFHAAGAVPTERSAIVSAGAYGVTFRFEQGQHHVMGGYLANPVLLDVTLLRAPTPDDTAPRIRRTTIDRFYPPVYDTARLAAHFAAQRWLPDTRDEGGALTRVAATNEGRGDNVSNKPPERWLAIHVDPARRVRVDLYAWRSAYAADEARALVRQVAATVTITPKLDERLATIVAENRRRDERARTGPKEAEAILRRCGVARLVAGEATFGATCVAHLSADSLELRLAVPMGRVPFAASRGTPEQVPQYAVAPDAPDFGVSLMYWNGARWSVAGLQYTISDQSLGPLLAVLATRLNDRASVYFLQTYTVDFEHYPDGVDKIGPFLEETERLTAALIGGTMLPGLRGTPARFDR